MAGTHKTLHVFATPIVTDELADAEQLNAALEAAILARMDAEPGIKRSNVGGWHSKGDLLQWAGDAGQRLVQHAIELARASTTNIQGGPVGNRWRVEAWANVSAGGHSNLAHVHGGAFWSVVYYVRVGEGAGGQLVFNDPRMPGLRMYAPALRFKGSGPEQVARLRPKAGQMLMFPAWLSHGVDPWDGDESRISIAMNLSVARPVPRRIAPATN